MSSFLQKSIERLVEKATITKIRSNKKKKFENHAVNILEAYQEDIQKDPETNKQFTNFTEEFFKGTDDGATAVAPPLTDLNQTLVDKLAKLNIPNMLDSNEATDEIYEVPESEKITANFPSKAKVKQLLKTNSDSGAKDILGHSNHQNCASTQQNCIQRLLRSN